MKPFKICVITGSRAEYGILSKLIKAISNDSFFKLELVVTGMHLSAEFGNTFQEIEKDGLSIYYKVEMLLSSDTPCAISKSMAIGMSGFADYYKQHKPDAILLLGDRYEIVAAALASVPFAIPVIHLHGGELSLGAIDDRFRHIITKSAQLHFTATETYKARVIQLGAAPDTVYNFGALSLDNLRHIKLLSKKDLEDQLGFEFGNNTYLVTYHPETMAYQSVSQSITALLTAIEQHKTDQFIFTYTNSDTNGRIINQKIDEYCQAYPKQGRAFKSLGYHRYLSMLPHMQAVIGNSSSGIIEVPSFKIPTINIGNRQNGRIMADSVINTDDTVAEISNAISKTKQSAYRSTLVNYRNPYDKEQTLENIIHVLKTFDFNQPYTFYDFKGSAHEKTYHNYC